MYKTGLEACLVSYVHERSPCIKLHTFFPFSLSATADKSVEENSRSKVRSLFLGSRWKFAHGKTMCIIICLCQIIALFITWGGAISLLPVAANIASTIAGYTHNGRKVRIAGMLINSPLWIIYDVIIGSWAGIADEVVSEISMLISIKRYGWKNLDKVEE
ncbi:MAG: YgjV family protein [Oscillospiraceae bacterium]|nr:YgjV family protein [Oscillospiraceae bacterium]